MDAIVVIMWLRVGVFSLFLVAGTCVVAEDAYGDPHLGCGDKVIAQEGSYATLSVTYDVGDRPTYGHVLTIRKPGQLENWIMCGWLKDEKYNHYNACDERPKILKLLDHTFQLTKTILVRKEDSGTYSVSLTVSTHQKEINKKCHIVLEVVEAPPTTTEDPEIYNLQQSASKSDSGKEESESNVASVVIAVFVTAVLVSLMWLAGIFIFYKRWMRRSLTGRTLTSVKIEVNNGTVASSPVENLEPAPENQNDPESKGLLNDSNHNSDERTSSPSPVAGDGLVHGAPEDGSCGSTNETSSLMMHSTVRQRSRGSDETPERC